MNTTPQFHRFPLLLAGLLSLVIAGCGGEKPCETSTDCTGGAVCLSSGGAEPICALDCSVSADDCGGEATCAGVGSLDVNVCQDPAGVPDSDNPPKEDEPTYIPCVDDAECNGIFPGSVCATYGGYSQCTLACEQDDECNPPPIGGVTTTFSACEPDEGPKDRLVCLPNEDCFTDPMSCIDLGDLFGSF